MIPGLPSSLSLAQTEQVAQTQENKTGGGTGGSGLRSAVVVNNALGGSKVTSGLSDGSTNLPWWGWVALGVGVLAIGWWALKRR